MGLKNLFGTHSERELKRIYPLVDKIEALRDEMKAKSDSELREKTTEFKERLEKGETLDDILVEAFAVVREAALRAIGLEPYRVQLIGGIILHQGRISEMKTGEGKTLVATLPSYLNALEGKGVHVVTVNDYLARRDAEQMGKVHEFLGLSVGVVLNDMEPEERQKAYNCDITYITNNELGFDYLRDNMVVYKEHLVQRGLHYAIIDEVDSILIDEARTPLIISGQSSKSTKLYEVCDILARQMQKGEASGEFNKMQAILGEEIEETGDFIVNEKDKVVNLTADGVKKVEQYFHLENLADPENLEIQHNIILALRANYLMFRDQDYVVQNDEVLIVDEFTGRIMPGRRYSDGLHQAIEAKEHVKVNRESQTLANITFQNFFNKYDKKAGMTGTALTEEKEFRDIYGMDVIEIPTNLPTIRIDHHDAVYKTQKEKFNAVIRAIEESHEKGQPVLVGTITIETSELLSKMLKKKGIEHNVLNAKFHEHEAKIVAQAGHYGAVTIATNMAGRGTDILLGGNPEFLAKDKVFTGYSNEEIEKILNPYRQDELDDEEKALKERYDNAYKEFKKETDEYKEKVISAGGLKIIGTERHESRRIDNQLRGRSGRQGDPGESKFYISLEDDLMRLFGSDRMMTIFNALGVPEDEEIQHKMLTKAIARAQEKIEINNFGIRKNLLEYDQVMNEQRDIIYKERKRVLDGESMRESIIKMIDDTIDRGIAKASSDEDGTMTAVDLSEALIHIVPVQPINDELLKKSREEIREILCERGHKAYEEKEKEFPEEESIREVERVVLLKVIDGKWMTHIDDMDQLRQGIGLQAYGQRDPLVEYKMLGYDMFDELSDGIQEDTVRALFSIKVEQKVEREEVAKPTGTNKDDTSVRAPKKRESKKVYPNDPCPCGSGLKYKNCCGRK